MYNFLISYSKIGSFFRANDRIRIYGVLFLLKVGAIGHYATLALYFELIERFELSTSTVQGSALDI